MFSRKVNVKSIRAEAFHYYLHLIRAGKPRDGLVIAEISFKGKPQ